MHLWIFVAAGAFAIAGIGAWFLSTRPILYTRLFVSRDERPLVRREIMDGPGFESGMKQKSVVLILMGAVCVAAAFLIKPSL